MLVEKLLRSCPDIGTIYILMRSKRGVSPSQRRVELTESEIFARLKHIERQEEEEEEKNSGDTRNKDNNSKKKKIQSQLDKIKVISGDITMPKLGISDSDLNLLSENVSIVIHSAATVKFNEPLKTAVDNNLVSVEHLLQVINKLSKLDALVHVSTAYSNCDLNEVSEKLYDPPIEPQKLIDMSKWMDSQLFEGISDNLLGKRPNTYTYTKACAESMLQAGLNKLNRQLPTAIVRPSIVTGSWREPIRGWVDNLNGPTGVVLAIMTGAIQAMLLKTECKGDLIPVDTVANLIICSAWKVASNNKTNNNHDDDDKCNLTTHSAQFVPILTTNQSSNNSSNSTSSLSIIDNNKCNSDDISKIRKHIERANKVQVFNCVSGTLNPIYWGQFAHILWQVGFEFPVNTMLRLPGKRLTGSPLVYRLLDIATNQWLAYVADFSLSLVGKKQMFVRLYTKCDKMVETLKPFVLNQWKFDCSNVIQLDSSLSSVDKRVFNINISKLDWHDYVSRYFIGCKLFVLRDEPGKLENARKALTRKQTASSIFTLIFIFLAYYFLLAGSSIESLVLANIRQYGQSIRGSASTLIAGLEQNKV